MQAVIFIGIQGAGKSTFYKDYFFDTHLRINLDQLRTRHREAAFLKTCLATRTRFVVDNTNPTVYTRERYLVPARKAGYEVIGYYFDTSLEAALLRNNQRQGKQRIPEAGVRAAYKKLELPSYEEGFFRIYRVTIEKKGEFVISPY